MERIIGNLEKVKLKLDEAFFYLDEIEELLQEDAVDAEASKVPPAAGVDQLRLSLHQTQWRIVVQVLQDGEQQRVHTQVGVVDIQSRPVEGAEVGYIARHA